MKFFSTRDEDACVVFKKKCVILSSPSEGNVGQLAMDIILSAHCSSKLDCIGSIESFDLLPCTGVDQLSSTSEKFLVAPLEVYAMRDTPFIFIQQRAICIRGRAQGFARDFMDLLASYEIDRLVIICGAAPVDVFENSFSQGNCLFSLIPQGTHDESSFTAAYPNLLKFISSTQQIQLQPASTSMLSVMSGFPLAKMLVQSEAFPVYLFGKFCSDGNNANDGIDLAKAVSKALCILGDDYFLLVDGVSRPASWLRLFGPTLHHSREVVCSVYY